MVLPGVSGVLLLPPGPTPWLVVNKGGERLGGPRKDDGWAGENKS